MGLRNKPTSLTDVARRWNRSPIPTGPTRDPEDPSPRPSGLIASGIILALVATLGGTLWVWTNGAPQNASATPAPAAAPEATSALTSARAFMAQNKWTNAEAILAPAVVNTPDDQNLRIARAETLAGLKRFGDAYNQYEKALAIGPREPKIEFAAGITASHANMIDRAVEHFSMAQTADPREPSYALWLGQMQRKQGNVEACKASLLRAANLDQNNALIWGTLADIALGENNVNIAIQHIARARTLQPDASEWRILDARAHKRKGEPDKALAILNGIASQQRMEAPVARMISECYSMLGRPADAASTLGDASLAAPTDGALAFDAALTFERAGNLTKAVEFAKYAKALGNPSAPKLLAKLGQ